MELICFILRMVTFQEIYIVCSHDKSHHLFLMLKLKVCGISLFQILSGVGVGFLKRLDRVYFIIIF